MPRSRSLGIVRLPLAIGTSRRKCLRRKSFSGSSLINGKEYRWPRQSCPADPRRWARRAGRTGRTSLCRRKANRCSLCLFDADGAENRLALPERDGDIWHGFVPGVGQGQALRFPGQRALRTALGACATTPPSCCSTRTLAQSRVRCRFGPELLGYATDNTVGAQPAGLGRPHAARAGPRRRCRPDRHARPTACARRHDRLRSARPRIHRRRIPTCHRELRGTYAGLAHEAALDHLVRLGVTAVELLPVHHNVPEAFLVERGSDELLGVQHHRLLRPARRLLGCSAGRPSGGQVDGVPAMVEALHAAGLEVVLDVVFNHTAEGGPGGPTTVLPRLGQRRVLPPRPERPGSLHRHDRVRVIR